MLTAQHIETVKSTIPVIEQGGVAITDHFYNRVFTHHPELKNVFNMSHQETGTQRVALFEAILAYAKNIDDLSPLKSAVERIAHKHTSFHIQPEHYAVVGHNLIETFRELLGDAFTPDIEEAWGQAYQVLADIFINREEELYQDSESKKGGWRGKRAFRIAEKTPESELVTSFVMVPVDEQSVCDFSPGQYIGIELRSNKLQYTEIRQYSLSDHSNNQSYRISVKREGSDPKGIASNFLHDEIHVGAIVDLYAPAGDFYLQDNDSPIVLISAGVGATPMQSMLEDLNQRNYSHPVHYVHACHNQDQHSFHKHNQSICEENSWSYDIWYSDVVEGSHAHQGYIDLTNQAIPIDKGDFYLCGPVAFMAYIKEHLIALGVSDERIHYEVFGPHASL
ncbi:NO-inducible flavohemoprotein [Vibrio sp.]|nr:NO-inducible flavohemoprotein [Vibrio sp.]